MDWFAAVDIYCERTAPGFWNEPLNALSNLSFIATAVWAGMEATKRRVLDAALAVSIGLAALIGIGSFLFHTFANVWSGLADVIPIWTFVIWFVGLSLVRFGGLSPMRAAISLGLILVAFGFAGWMLSSGDAAVPQEMPQSDPLNGSQQYLPALLALYGFAAFLLWRRHPAGNWITAAAAVFTVSLVFRTIDPAICAKFPAGTHAFWHLLNGLMIGLILQAMIRHGVAPSTQACKPR